MGGFNKENNNSLYGVCYNTLAGTREGNYKRNRFYRDSILMTQQKKATE